MTALSVGRDPLSNEPIFLKRSVRTGRYCTPRRVRPTGHPSNALVARSFASRYDCLGDWHRYRDWSVSESCADVPSCRHTHAGVAGLGRGRPAFARRLRSPTLNWAPCCRKAGGEYVYLRRSYGQAVAFLYGWQRFIVAGSASIATLGTGLAIFLSTFLPLDQVWLAKDFQLLGQTIHWTFGAMQVVAVSAICVMTGVNCLTVMVGGKVSTGTDDTQSRRHRLCRARRVLRLGLRHWSHLSTPVGTAQWCGWSLFGHSHAGRAVGLRWLEQHADGSRRGAPSRSQYSTGAHLGHGHRHGNLLFSQPLLLLRAAH